MRREGGELEDGEQQLGVWLYKEKEKKYKDWTEEEKKSIEILFADDKSRQDLINEVLKFFKKFKKRPSHAAKKRKIGELQEGEAGLGKWLGREKGEGYKNWTEEQKASIKDIKAQIKTSIIKVKIDEILTFHKKYKTSPKGSAKARVDGELKDGEQSLAQWFKHQKKLGYPNWTEEQVKKFSMLFNYK